ncbi:MAG: hypothetical protein BMS9Abin08_1291 [Gammaproteobacteria bacterium]|nr:MAG: hypothetical protein BMS9Abin08_1291 [Gammaproteobacteria bacterium]
MKTLRLLLAATIVLCKTTFATDYIVDFTRVSDFETLRPLVTGCEDFSAMELYRDRLETADNLEDMREVFMRSGLGMFNECPADVSGEGITLIK